MRGHLWRLYLGVGALAVGGYYLLPPLAGAAFYVVVGASASFAVVVGVRWHRPLRRTPWWLIAAAQALFVAGDALFSVNDLLLGIEPFPSLADALYLPGYPVLTAGLALLALSRSTGRRDWAGLTDAAIIAIGFGLLSWVLVIVPYFDDPSLGLVELLVSEAYPVGDVLLLALAARLATTLGRRTVAFRLLIANLAVTLAADTLFSVLTLSGASAAVTDGMYLAAYLLLGASGLHPSMAELSEPARRVRGPRLGRGRLLAMGAAALAAPALLVLQRLRGVELQLATVTAAWAVLFVLVMARMAGLVRVIERAEAERRRVLDRTVRAAEEERMHVATELHDGPIQRLAVLSYDLERAKQRVLGNPAAVARIEHAQAALSAEVQGLRELMATLRPPTLDEVGLEAALRDHVGAFARRSGVACSVRVDLDGRLDGELETVVYRVTQEALLNVARHAEADRLWLRLDGTGDRVDLEIGDDGVGFEPQPTSTLVRDGHFGLVAMRERVEMAGGRFQVDTHPGAGVRVRAMFQLPRAA
jgi:signal transduction histidine kinase